MSATDAEVATKTWLDRLGVLDRVESKVEALSHGNQQRVQLAAALVHGPELLILDEPLAGLDPSGIDAIGGVLVEQARAGCCVLFSSHQLDQVEDLCESVTIIDHGRLVVTGKVDDLATSGPRRLVVRVEGDREAFLGARPGRCHHLRDRRRRGATRAGPDGGQPDRPRGGHGDRAGHRVRIRAPPAVRGVPGGSAMSGKDIRFILRRRGDPVRGGEDRVPAQTAVNPRAGSRPHPPRTPPTPPTPPAPASEAPGLRALQQ